MFVPHSFLYLCYADIAREKVVQQAAQVDVKMLNHVETEEKSQLPTQTGTCDLIAVLLFPVCMVFQLRIYFLIYILFILTILQSILSLSIYKKQFNKSI